MADSKISIALSAVDKFTKPAKNIIQTAGKLEHQITQTDKHLKGLSDQQNLITRFKKLTAGLDQTRAAMKQAAQQTNQLKQNQTNAKAALAQHTTALDQAERSVLKLAKTQGAHAEQLAQAKQHVKQLTQAQSAATKQYSAELANAQKQALNTAKAYGAESKQAKAATAKVQQLTKAKAIAAKQQATALANAQNNVKKAAAAYGAHSQQVKAATAKVQQLTQAKKAAEKTYKQEQAQLKNAQIKSTQLTNAYGKQAKELGGLRKDMSAAGLKMNSLGAQELKLARQTDQASQALDRQKAKLQKIQTLKGRIADRNAQKGELVGQAVGLAVKTAPLIMASKRAVEYESTFADVKKVVNFTDQKEEAQYRTQMMKLAGRLGVEQQGIADIVTAAGQSGIEKDQLLQFAESATKMSVAWDVSAEEAGSTLATWRAAMGLTQKNALDLADSTNYLSNNMNAKAKDIAAVMVRQGSTAMGAGLNYNQTAALSASLIAGGATQEVAATALKNITGRLTTGYAATAAQQDAMGRIGFDAEELADMMQQDAQGTLVEVMRGLQDVNATDRGAVISQLFGEEVKGAVAKLVTTLDDDKNGLVAAFAKVANQADRANSVNDEYANRAATRGHKLAMLGAKFDRMTIVLGDRLLPVLDAVLPPLMTAVDGIANFAEANPKLTSSLLGVAAAIAAVKAGAIAFKLAKLTLGNGRDRLNLGRTKLNLSTDQTTQSANRASRSLDRLNRKLNGLGAGAGYGGRARRAGARTANSGNTRGSSRLATLRYHEEHIADANTTRQRAGGRKGSRIAGRFGKLSGFTGLKSAGRFFRPLDMAMQGMSLASAISQGSGTDIGATAGDMVGGMGGAAAGGLAGAAIGSVVPIIGTAIGGLVGSIAGGMGGGSLGEWIGGKLGGWFSEDKTDQPAPDAIAKQSQQLQNNNKSMTFAPTIHLTPTGNSSYDQQLSDQVIERLKAEFGYSAMGNMDVATRADGSLGDKRGS
ncbi:phage tail tape measure protein [Marinomonas aquiplantarum]|uniref:TP901 family phage tail tape measure protein n=1 Tax=Marinomonas aquiplantarum TaxID=491951 RepID=A0A366CXV4_9GAMM|nr:phage tail tape measure protein [Marinomonas aquiplantarum]RBO82643.1 TP901 family phage tail tape measure protein [Marinomonas aquiplantarum]